MEGKTGGFVDNTCTWVTPSGETVLLRMRTTACEKTGSFRGGETAKDSAGSKVTLVRSMKKERLGSAGPKARLITGTRMVLLIS